MKSSTDSRRKAIRYAIVGLILLSLVIFAAVYLQTQQSVNSSNEAFQALQTQRAEE